MNWDELLLNDTAIGAAAGTAAVLWGAVKSTEWWERRMARRRNRAVSLLEAGVVRTYERYVREIKRARADGKLSAAERRRARELAIETATAIGRKEGIDLLRTLGRDHIEPWIERVLRRLKRA